ncbi:MAG: polyprenyl synthetase family protein [Clostridiales bacterium]|nr:polyprenyl synthetase family protein [Clostridiales bacterium]
MSNEPGRTKRYTLMINEKLEKLLPAAKESVVCEAMRYSVFNGGKRIRPVLTLEFCRLCGGREEEALSFACAVEMIHAYSLIHDDLPCMDDDDTRRGNPACHIRFGEANARLAGDALLTLAFETVLNAGLTPEMIINAGKELSAAAGWAGMIGGQVMDLQNEGKQVELEELLETDYKKTGKLIIASAVLGCIAAGAEEEKVRAAAQYAYNLGLAFQLVDDILDVTGNAETLGKPVVSDEGNKKTTYVSVIGTDAAKEKISGLTLAANDALKIFGEQAEYLQKLADSLTKRKK